MYHRPTTKTRKDMITCTSCGSPYPEDEKHPNGDFFCCRKCRVGTLRRQIKGLDSTIQKLEADAAKAKDELERITNLEVKDENS